MSIWIIAALLIGGYMLMRNQAPPAKPEGSVPVALPNPVPKLAVPTVSDGFEALQILQARLVANGHFPSEIEAVVQPLSKLLLATPVPPTKA